MRVIAAVMVVLGLALPVNAEMQEVTEPAQAMCPEGQSVSIETLAGTHKAILFGEYHGTREMPEVFGDMVGEAAAGGRRVVVALEYRANWQADLDAVMAAPNEVSALDAFAMHSTRDGRTSDAMRNLLLQLRALKLAGANVTVRAIDMAWPDPTAVSRAAELGLPPGIDQQYGLRNIIMGLNAVQVCEEAQCDLLMVYAGNMHTRLDVMDSSIYNPIEEKVIEFREAPAGYIIVQNMPTAAVYLGHRGGWATNRTKLGFGMHEIEPVLPDFAVEDGIIYCMGNGTYFQSVGKIYSSEDSLAGEGQ